SRAIYIDGGLENSHRDGVAVTVPNISDPARLGSWENAATTDYDGRLDEVRISTRARSSNWTWAVWMNMASNNVFNCGVVEPSFGPTEPIENRTPTWFGSNTAGLNGALNATGAIYDTFIYWGMTDGGSNPAAWANMAPMGRFTNVYTDLQRIEALATTGTWYYTWRATNQSEDLWAAPVEIIPDLSPLSVLNGVGATDLSPPGKATLNGVLERNDAEVTVFWGPSDGGTNPAAWKNAVSLGPRTTGPFSSIVTGAYYGQTYYYRTYATNALAEDWADTSAMFRNTRPAGPKQLTLSFCGYDRIEPLTNFPALVVLEEGVSGFSHIEFLRPDGYDLRIYNEETNDELNYEIESWNTNGISWVWVQVPELAGTNTSIRLEWGNPLRADQPVYTTNGATWSADYAGVWHLNKTNGLIEDSANRAPPGTPAGAPEQGTPGVMGDAIEFDNELDYYTFPSFDHVTGSRELTISAWSRIAEEGISHSADGAIVGRGGNPINAFLLYYDYEDGSTRDYTYTFNVGNWNTSQNRINAGNDAGQFPGEWVHVAGVMNRKHRGIFINGERRNSRNNASSETVPTIPGGGTRLGAGEVFSGLWYDGRLDEVRISTVERSSNWLWAAWRNMSEPDRFTCLEVEPALGRVEPLHNLPPTWFGSNTVGFNASLNASGAVYAVAVFWGPAEGGTNPAGWANTMSVGHYTNLTTNLQWIETLTLPTDWYVTWRATNEEETIWAQPSVFLENPALPEVDNGSGALGSKLPGQEILTGNLMGNSAEVTVFWGESDGGTDPNAWARSAPLGNRQPGPLSVTVTGVVYGLTYFYRTYATNDLGEAWAGSSELFTPIRPNGPREVTVTFCGYDRGETLTGFPALIQLSPAWPDFSYADFLRPDGYDLRIYDNQARELNYEIDTWTTNGISAVWVQIPELAGPTTSVQLVWGDPSTTGQPAYTTNGATWSNGYVGVWHLGETNGPVFDATRTMPPGIPQGDPVRDAPGFIGGADGFNNVKDFFVLPDFEALNGQSEFTISAWNYLHSASSGDSAVLTKGSDDLNSFYLIYDRDNGMGEEWTYTLNVGPLSQTANRLSAGDRAGLLPRTWKHLTGVMNGSMREIYLDGVLQASHNTGLQLTVPDLPGAARLGGWSLSPDMAYDGRLDEVRVSSVARSSNWNWAVWRNMRDNASFLCVSNRPGRLPGVIVNRAPTWSASNTVNFRASLDAVG
ncbi:MAG: DUF2341 domain-containing protein, partial [Verrucomicrobiota bacterium]